MSTEIVECYSGQSYPDRPKALHWEGERLEILEIEARWRFPGGFRFWVRTEDDQSFELLYDEPKDEWQVRLR
ncbi:MAG: hypothetical protein GTO18_04645 [Anaerolineales bacterium]|nr:hypothetical protein [Anaerolineales bacterium]